MVDERPQALRFASRRERRRTRPVITGRASRVGGHGSDASDVSALVRGVGVRPVAGSGPGSASTRVVLSVPVILAQAVPEILAHPAPRGMDPLAPVPLLLQAGTMLDPMKRHEIRILRGAGLSIRATALRAKVSERSIVRIEQEEVGVGVDDEQFRVVEVRGARAGWRVIARTFARRSRRSPTS